MSSEKPSEFRHSDLSEDYFKDVNCLEIDNFMSSTTNLNNCEIISDNIRQSLTRNTYSKLGRLKHVNPTDAEGTEQIILTLPEIQTQLEKINSLIEENNNLKEKLL